MMGRPPKDPEARKSAPIGIRLPPDLRHRLDDERKKAEPERSISQEIELRLRQSLEQPRRFRDKRIYDLALMIEEGIVDYIQPATRQNCWKDPYTFDQVKKLIDEFLKFLRPEGKRIVPKHFKLPKDGVFAQLRDFLLPSVGVSAARAVLPLYQMGSLGMGMPRKYQRAGPSIAVQLARAGHGLKNPKVAVIFGPEQGKSKK